MSEIHATLESLFTGLEALRSSLLVDDNSAAERLMAEHDQRLHQYCQQQGAQASTPALQELLALQQSLMGEMIRRRDDAGLQLRNGRQSVRAARAYHQAESLG